MLVLRGPGLKHEKRLGVALEKKRIAKTGMSDLRLNEIALLGVCVALCDLLLFPNVRRMVGIIKSRHLEHLSMAIN